MLRAPGLITVRAVPNVQHHGQIRSDAALLNAHIAGDRYAFGELYLRHQVQLHQLARLRSQTAEDAEDAVQDAMLAAHRSAGAFRHDSAVSSWLHRIVVNACIDRTRRNRWPTTEITEHSAVIHDPPASSTPGSRFTALCCGCRAINGRPGRRLTWWGIPSPTPRSCSGSPRAP